ncbi:MAG: ribulose-phosphate 3-epimerase [Bacilli bacterium]|nr:ribulose-phosphate 3-epimerase [Bacilli bacterium]
MKIAGSFLKIQEDIDKIKELEKRVDQIHFDIMDGIFTENKTIIKEINIEKDIDIHLMVLDIKSYVDKVLKYRPKYITFHLEATDNIIENIDYIKEKNIKVGIAINPETDIEKVYKYLDKIDLVLLMSVKPGKGGQKFIDITEKLNKLYNYRKENNLSFIIEVDGGINNETIKKVKKADIVVCGSFITDSTNYEGQVKLLKHNAFTLAELLGVIIILSIIGLISFSAIDRNLKEGRIKTCKAQEKNIIEGAKTWAIDDPSILPTDIPTTKTIQELENNGYIEEGLKNPMTDEEYKSGTEVEIKKAPGSNNKYTYKIVYDTANGDKGC